MSSRAGKFLPNYYKILNISRNATSQEIKDAFYKLAKVHHPDVAKDHKDDKFKQISEAYQILKVSDSKKEYDSLLTLQEEAEKMEYNRNHASSAYQSQASASGSSFSSTGFNPASGGPKGFSDFKNQYEYYEFIRRQPNAGGGYTEDYSKYHKFHDKYQQYFTQKNVFDQKYRKPFEKETIEHKYDPQTNTHYYFHRKSGPIEEEIYSQLYTMQGTYDSYERSKNIPNVFGYKLEHVLFAIATVAILYGMMQYKSTQAYKPYSNVYQKRKSEEV